MAVGRGNKSDVGATELNKLKNRYKDILPCKLWYCKIHFVKIDLIEFLQMITIELKSHRLVMKLITSMQVTSE